MNTTIINRSLPYAKLLLTTAVLCVFSSLPYVISHVFAEQSGSSPESGSTSRILEAYNWLVAKGVHYGATDAADWTNTWGIHWNRIMEAAAWEPDGTATAAEVPRSLTYYAGNNDRIIQTGTLYSTWHLQDYDDVKCTGNNRETNTACSGGDFEYVGEEGTWTLKTTGGTAVTVTDNAVTVTIASNRVYMDNRTKLYWSERSNTSIDNEFMFINGDDRVNPASTSCNFNSTATANQYCDNQDPTSVYVEDNDVSAAEFCLNLALDADNADADSNGATGTETDWRLPTQKEAIVAYANGAENNLNNAQANMWTSTELNNSGSAAWLVNMGTGVVTNFTKSLNNFASCVRRDP
jgi:hypothetical protein